MHVVGFKSNSPEKNLMLTVLLVSTSGGALVKPSMMRADRLQTQPAIGWMMNCWPPIGGGSPP